MSLPPSPPCPGSSSPSPGSWRRSDVESLIAALLDADDLLRQVYAVESRRSTSEHVLDAADAIRHAREDLQALLRGVSRPHLAAALQAAEDADEGQSGPTNTHGVDAPD